MSKESIDAELDRLVMLIGIENSAWRDPQLGAVIQYLPRASFVALVAQHGVTICKSSGARARLDSENARAAIESITCQSHLAVLRKVAFNIARGRSVTATVKGSSNGG